MGRRTPLFGFHSSHGHIGDFVGFDMPLWYEGIVLEVTSVRERAGLFDISHMGKARFEGKEAGRFLDHLTTNEVSTLQPLQARYCLLCNEDGGILDDVIVVRFGEEYQVVWNASNREKNLKWSMGHLKGFDVKIEELSDRSFMFALQGPLAQKVLQPLCDADLAGLKRFRGTWGEVRGAECLITRTGYTGEDGFEIFSTHPERAEKVWTAMLSSGAVPAGLGARDVLRTEAGFPLYGHDINEAINPFEARLEFAVKLEKPDFLGKDALLKISKEGVRRRRTGIRMVDRAIPREGFEILLGGKEIGHVTSGTYSPTLKTGIAMGYINVELAPGTEVFIDIRGRESRGVVSGMPFYDTERYGWKRKQT
ncbi:MAG: glycine cleavage system aminomethyltransferase GcvT [Candidatus Verstraetearchaeota archaeon]|nr:glycine cleavage system aminomethyltransferase GcvT [Candidatus Verstraetearchaeota archaeon]